MSSITAIIAIFVLYLILAYTSMYWFGRHAKKNAYGYDFDYAWATLCLILAPISFIFLVIVLTSLGMANILEKLGKVIFK